MRDDQKTEMMRAANSMVADIEFLATREEFVRFMDSFKSRADGLAEEILHADMTAEEREAKRQFRMGIMEVLRWPSDTKRSCMRLLNQS